MEISFQRIIDSIDGNVNSQGIKVRFPAWMVIGSDEWNSTPDNIKAYAYQAAKVTGWSDESLISAVTSTYKHIHKHMALFTIEELKRLTEEHKLEIIEHKKVTRFS